jgi:hypothetical protein
MRSDEIRSAWSKLLESGTPHEDLDVAMHVLPALTVGLDVWIDRLAKRYLQDLSRRGSHFKLVVGPYGSGKTHFLLSLASRALQENFAVSFLKCKEGVSLDQPVAFYQEMVRNLRLPGTAPIGLRPLLQAVHKSWKDLARNTPDAVYAWETKLEELEEQPGAFGRVAAAALRHIENPSLNREQGKAAFLWLNGEHKDLTRADRESLRLGNVTNAEMRRFGHLLRESLTSFIPNAGVHGLVLLVDESESMVTARGKALTYVLNAMRTIIDEQGNEFNRMPMLCVFAAIHDIQDKIQNYQALRSRLLVVGQPFHEGSDSAPQIDLEHLGSPKGILRKIGERLVSFGEQALEYKFNSELQEGNLQRLVEVVVVRKTEADARRLFVKAWSALLEEQKGAERPFSEQELQNRVSGAYEQIRERDENEEDYA